MQSEGYGLGCFRRVVLVGLIAGWLLPAIGSAFEADARQDTARTAAIASLTGEVNALLNLEKSEVVSLNGGGTAAASLTVGVPIDGELYMLDLAPHSVRSDVYEVKAQLADGSYVNVEPGPARTLRGTVVGLDGSVVAASRLGDGLYARIRLPDGATYWIEPIGSRVAGAAPDQHVVYRAADVIPSGGTCIALHTPTDAVAGSAESGRVASGGLFNAELAIDADYDYFLEYGSVEATVDQIENVINMVNVQYERDVAIRHVITRIIVRTTAEENPYTTNDPEDLLQEFSAHWRSWHSSVQRDVAHLFTGRDLEDGTIGVAWVGSICYSREYPYTGYSAVQSDCATCGSLACKADLSAHELGHNWGADHCGDEDGIKDCYPPCPDHTMNCYIRCANQFHDILTIPEIVAFRDTRPCLDEGDDLRRIILGAESDTVPEGGTLQFTAIADFRFGDNEDVTTEADWSVNRPEAGWINSNGLFTAFEVDGNVCVTVSASYTAYDTTRANNKTIVVIDADTSLTIVAGVPPDGVIDARQPSESDGSNPAGWRSFDLIFNGETCLMAATDFTITQEGGTSPAPLMASFEHVGSHTVQIGLSRIIGPGAWTTITHAATGAGVRIGYLPGDANADGLACPIDILAIIDNLSGQVDPTFEMCQCDIDRSEVCASADILRLIDLLNGADAYEPWSGRTLP